MMSVAGKRRTLFDERRAGRVLGAGRTQMGGCPREVADVAVHERRIQVSQHPGPSCNAGVEPGITRFESPSQKIDSGQGPSAAVMMPPCGPPITRRTRQRLRGIDEDGSASSRSCGLESFLAPANRGGLSVALVLLCRYAERLRRDRVGGARARAHRDRCYPGVDAAGREPAASRTDTRNDHLHQRTRARGHYCSRRTRRGVRALWPRILAVHTRESSCIPATSSRSTASRRAKDLRPP